MSSLAWPTKDKDEYLDYVVDWSARLGADTIAASTFTVPSGLTPSSQTFTDTTTTTWLADGVDGASYDILNHIVTAAGRIMEQTIKLKVKEK